MASEKQVAYIQSLISKMSIENHPAWQSRSNGVDEADRQRKLAQRENLQRQEMVKSLDLENIDTDGMSDAEVDAYFDRIDHMSHAEALALYQAKIDELSSTDWAAVDSQTASRTIDSLKRFRFPA